NGCFSLMFGYDKSINLGFDAALVNDDIISWISLNSSKPERNTTSCLVIHSSNQWADNHINDNRDEILEIIFERAKKILNID
ncbi:amine oxidase, partial [Francisella tularensis subsp. holarctica]|nr:amine oxidase [Francisella tularensis subsp. holarctica]